MEATIERRDVALLWKMLNEQKPHIAAELSSQLIGETDLSKLPYYLNKFCLLNNCFIKGALYKSSIIEKRRLFIGTILAIYKPHTRALAISLSHLLKIEKGNMSKLIDETLSRYKNPNIKSDIDSMAAKMKGVNKK